jgi:LmbE family N-acetylglucosaminyl deacetylase
MKIVCIGAHPDDVELGMAGTVAKHTSKGDDVHIIICTLGIGGDCGDAMVRESEAREAARILGTKLQILDYPVTRLNRPSREFELIIKRVIEDLSPTRVYTHSPFDYHQVHESTCECVVKAARDVPQLLHYEEASSTSPDFKPNAYTDITDHIDSKLKCIEVHATQGNKLYMQSTTTTALARARYVLSKIGTRPNGMAEAFSISRLIVQRTDNQIKESNKEANLTSSSIAA